MQRGVRTDLNTGESRHTSVNCGVRTDSKAGLKADVLRFFDRLHTETERRSTVYKLVHCSGYWTVQPLESKNQLWT